MGIHSPLGPHRRPYVPGEIVGIHSPSPSTSICARRNYGYPLAAWSPSTSICARSFCSSPQPTGPADLPMAVAPSNCAAATPIQQALAAPTMTPCTCSHFCTPCQEWQRTCACLPQEARGAVGPCPGTPRLPHGKRGRHEPYYLRGCLVLMGLLIAIDRTRCFRPQWRPARHTSEVIP